MSTKRGALYVHGRHSPSQPGDEVVGGWSREQLEKMDARFRTRLERAITNGKEHVPIHFTDQQLALLRELALPLAPSQRAAFLKEVARRLHGVEQLGDGAVAQAAREAQAEIRKASPWLQA
jgi:hypothetical protein